MHPYVQDLVAADPILGSSLGHRGSDPELGDISAEGMGSMLEMLRSWRDRTESLEPAPEGTPERLEQQLLLGEVRSRLREGEVQRPWSRAPYWHVERCGEAISGLIGPGFGPGGEDALLSRVRQLGPYLTTAAEGLDAAEVPELWAQMGHEAATGLVSFLTRDLTAYASAAPDALRRDLESELDHAAAAAQAYAELCARLTQEARGDWRAGRAYLDGQLSDLHALNISSEDLLEHGQELIARAEEALRRSALQLDSEVTWDEQLEAIKDDCPDGDTFLDAYKAAVGRARAWVLEHDLVSIPEGEACEVRAVPDFLRASLPLGCMEVVRPYAGDLTSSFLITPLDPTASPESQEQHRRDNSYAFIESIAGHETYPGHHLQSVHHVLGTAPGSIGRFVRSSLFVEGWGLYVEDLIEESGAAGLDVLLVQRRNALWRALRVVLDMGMHQGKLSFGEAVGLLRDRAGLGEHMASGEVRRYTRHDNPTYPSSYALGRAAFHRLRDRWQSECRGGLRAFHDAVLAHGSPPQALLEPLLFARGVQQ